MMEEEFTISTGMKVFYFAIAAFTACFALFLFTLDHTKAGQAVIIIPIALLLLAALIAINQVKSKVIISQYSIIRSSVWGTRKITCVNVKGYRLGQKIINIEPMSSTEPKITINNYIDLGDNEELVKWLTENFTDLDKVNLENEQTKILQDTTLGATPEERQAKVKIAKQVAISYNLIGAILGFSVIFIGNKYAAALITIPYPLLGIIIMMTSGGLTKFLSNSKRSVNPFIMIGFLMPAFMMLIMSLFNFEVYQYKNFWLPFSLLSLILVVLIYATGINKTLGSIWGQMVMIVIASSIYAFGCCIQVNCVFDKSTSQQYKATVLDLRIQRSKSTNYYLTLSAWGPQKESKEVEVGRELFNEVAIGKTVNVNLKKGLLQIPWFTISD